MWGSLEHKFVLQFIGIHEIEHEMAPQYFLISPYMKNGTLAQWRKRRNPSTAEIEERVRLSFSVFASRLTLAFIPLGRYWKLPKVSSTFIQKAQFMAISAGYPI